MTPFRYEDLDAMSTPLPYDVRSLVDGGYFSKAQALIDSYLSRDISENMKSRLRMEKEIIKRLPGCYPYNFYQALEQARTVYPDLTEEGFRELQSKGRIDWIYIDGAEHFISSTADTLENDRGYEVPGSDPDNHNNRVRGSLVDMKKNGSDSWTFRIRFTARIEDKAFRPGKVKVYIPFVYASPYVSDIKILETSSPDYYLADELAPQRTICFIEDIKENHDFFVEYEYTATARYVDLWNDEALVTADKNFVDPENLPADVKADDLGDLNAHIQATPFLRALCAEITEGLETPLEKVRAIYDYIVHHVTYSYVRSYFTIENLGEYVALNQKGDCGLQGLMFINLCRIAGIPARWESGNQLRTDRPGLHDWAMFYLAPYGWLFCDPSYGAGACRAGEMDRCRHYLGNLDPFRLPSNAYVARNFDPPMQFIRDDPYDNQAGEIEYEDGSLELYEEFRVKREVTQAVHNI